MNEARPSHSAKAEPGEDAPEVTLDLDLDEFEEGKDLQAVADEAARSAAAETGEDAPEAKEAALFKARERIKELEKLEAEYQDKHHRLLADFANHRNRVARETQLAVTLAEKKLLAELLPVLDSFERGLAANYPDVEDLRNGVALIQKQLQEALRKAGVQELEVKVGDPFDATHAEALTTTSVPDLPDGVVAAIYERGYKLKDHLLRPARVIVNHAPSAEE